jgi:hypothetical protein
MILFITTAVKTSNPTNVCLDLSAEKEIIFMLNLAALFTEASLTA